MSAMITELPAYVRWKKSKRVAVVSAHEDLSTGTRVDEFCRSLSLYLGEDCTVDKQMWLFSELRIQNLRTIAADDAAQADLIIISLHHALTLPQEVERWIQLWQRKQSDRPRILLALFDPVYQGTSAPIKEYLEEIARQENLTFIAQSDEGPEER